MPGGIGRDVNQYALYALRNQCADFQMVPVFGRGGVGRCDRVHGPGVHDGGQAADGLVSFNVERRRAGLATGKIEILYAEPAVPLAFDADGQAVAGAYVKRNRQCFPGTAAHLDAGVAGKGTFGCPQFHQLRSARQAFGAVGPRFTDEKNLIGAVARVGFVQRRP